MKHLKALRWGKMVRTLGLETVKIGLVQSKVGSSLDENLEKASKLIGKAAAKGAKIVCLQELFYGADFVNRTYAIFFLRKYNLRDIALMTLGSAICRLVDV